MLPAVLFLLYWQHRHLFELCERAAVWTPTRGARVHRLAAVAHKARVGAPSLGFYSPTRAPSQPIQEYAHMNELIRVISPDGMHAELRSKRAAQLVREHGWTYVTPTTPAPSSEPVEVAYTPVADRLAALESETL